jgi:hypothetical protein
MTDRQRRAIDARLAMDQAAGDVQQRPPIEPPPTTPAGWYPHPSMAQTRRYWDGAQWTSHIAPAVDGPESSPPAPITTAPMPAEELAPSSTEIWLGRLARAVSLRAAGYSLFWAFVLCLSLGLILQDSAWFQANVGFVYVVTAAIIWLGIVANDSQVMVCPACRKNVKIGATACHHCGRSTVA